MKINKKLLKKTIKNYHKLLACLKVIMGQSKQGRYALKWGETLNIQTAINLVESSLESFEEAVPEARGDE